MPDQSTPQNRGSEPSNSRPLCWTPLLDIEQAAECAGIPAGSLRSAVHKRRHGITNKGDIGPPFVEEYAHKKIRFRLKDVEAWVAAKRRR